MHGRVDLASLPDRTLDCNGFRITARRDRRPPAPSSPQQHADQPQHRQRRDGEDAVNVHPCGALHQRPAASTAPIRHRGHRYRAELAEQGATVLDQDAARDPAAADLRSLADADGNDLTEDNHAQCPGHGAVVLPSWGTNVRVAWLCTDWKTHGHRDRHGRVTGPMTEEQKQERRELIATNKAWDSAEQVRRTWLRDFLTRKSAPKDAAQYVARTMLANHRTVGSAVGDNNQLLAELLGHEKPSSWDEPPLLAAATTATPARAQMLTLGMVLAGIESSLTRHSWRNPSREAAAYLNALTGWGYELADVERIITEHESD